MTGNVVTSEIDVVLMCPLLSKARQKIMGLVTGDRGEFEFRPHEVTIKSNKIFGDRKWGRHVANDTKHFKSFYNSVVSVTVEMELTSLKVPRDLYGCERAI